MNGCMCSLPLQCSDKARFSKWNGSSCVVAKLKTYTHIQLGEVHLLVRSLLPYTCHTAGHNCTCISTYTRTVYCSVRQVRFRYAWDWCQSLLLWLLHSLSTYHFVWVHYCIYTCTWTWYRCRRVSCTNCTCCYVCVWVALTNAEPVLIVYRHTYGAEEHAKESQVKRTWAYVHQKLHNSAGIPRVYVEIEIATDKNTCMEYKYIRKNSTDDGVYTV